MKSPPHATVTKYELVPFDDRRGSRRWKRLLIASGTICLFVLAAIAVSSSMRHGKGEPANLRHWTDIAANQAAQIPTAAIAGSHVAAAGLDIAGAPFVLESESNTLQPTPLAEELHPVGGTPAFVGNDDRMRSNFDVRIDNPFLLKTDDEISGEPVSINMPQLGHENIVFANTKLQEAIHRAERGALFSSRAMLIETLRDVCRMLDATSGGQNHSASLVAALTALDEADDFQYRGVHAEADLETDGFITGHDTTILKGQKGTSSLRARDAYYNYARDELTKACCGQAVAAKACFALARVESMMRRQKATTRRGGPREIPLFQASLNVNPNDHVTANELGVALARAGHLRRAAKTLDNSIQLRPDPTAMSNLAKVYQQLGNPQQAARLQQQIAGTRSAPVQRVASQVQLVSVDEFGNEHAGRAHSVEAMNYTPSSARGAASSANSAPPINRRVEATQQAPPTSRSVTPRSLWGTFQHARPNPNP